MIDLASKLTSTFASKDGLLTVDLGDEA